jgi:hypothetical protein
MDGPRPTPGRPDHAQMAYDTPDHAWLVGGTPLAAAPLRAPAVLQASTGQAPAEGGVRVLNDPLCFGASVCGHTPCRMPGLLLVMT